MLKGESARDLSSQVLSIFLQNLTEQSVPVIDHPQQIFF